MFKVFNFFKKQVKNKIAYTISKNIKKAIDDIQGDLKLNKSKIPAIVRIKKSNISNNFFSMDKEPPI